jgi:hypothetical protein
LLRGGEVTTRVRVRLAGAGEIIDTWAGAVEAKGPNLAAAVRAAMHKIHLPGRTRSAVRIDTHEWSWDWSGHMLRVRESRSGPGGGQRGAGTRVVSLSMRADDAAALDNLAETWGLSRSAAVVKLVREFSASAQPL